MINKPKSKKSAADRKQLADAANKRSTARGAMNAELSEQERAGAMQRLFAEKPGLGGSLRLCKSTFEAAAKAKVLLFDDYEFRSERIGGEQLTAFDDGVAIDRDGRKAVLTWDEIADEAWDRDEESDEPAADGGLSTATPGGIEAINPGGAVSPGSRAKRPAAAAANAPAGSAAAGGPSSPGPIDHSDELAVSMAIKSIEANPWQPRLDWAGAGIDELAAELKADGLLQRILVRPHPTAAGRYQIVDGERRLRAAKQLGWLTVGVVVRQVTDQQMAELALKANLERRDLNAIEEAQAFEQLISWFGLTQEQVAQRFKISAPQVSNRLRLLKLPKEWQARVISREIPATHARSLVPWAERPAVLAYLAKQIPKTGPVDYSLEEWDGAVLDAAYSVSRDRYPKSIPRMQLTEEQHADLDVVDVPERWGRGNSKSTEKRAFNVKAFDKLWAAHVKTEESSAASKSDKREERKAKVKRKLTAAQINANKEKQAKQFADRLRRWKVDWLRYLACCAIKHQAAFWVETKALLWLAMNQAGMYGTERERFFRDRSDALESALTSCGMRITSRDDWRVLSGRSSGEIIPLARVALQKLLFDEKNEGPQPHFPEEIVRGLAADLSIDTSAWWRKELAGPLTDRYFELHNKEQLVELGKEWGVYLEDSKPKSTLIKLLVDNIKTKAKLPSELAERKPREKGNRKAAKAAKRKGGAA